MSNASSRDWHAHETAGAHDQEDVSPMSMTEALPLGARRQIGRALRAFSWAAAFLLYFVHRLQYAVMNHRMTRLHVGCGKNRFPGWINADISPGADLVVFLEKRLPVRAESLDRIYCEHVLEHVPYETAIFFLKEALRTLRPGGRIRIAVPDLEDLVAGYFHDDWKERFDWAQWPEHGFISTRAEMINIAFRWWGHRHLYDRAEMARALTEAGFVDFQFFEHGESGSEDLRGLETRADSKLIVEAAKS